MARGEFIWVAEADDYADLALLQTLIDLLDNNQRVVVAYAQSVAVDENENQLFHMNLGNDFVEASHWESNYINSGVNECRSCMLYFCSIPNFSAVVFRRAALERVGFLDENFKLCADWLHWIRMLMQGDVAFVAQPLNYFRWHANSVRNRTSMLRYVYERYLVLDYLQHHLPLTEREISLVSNKIMKDWLKYVRRRREWGAWDDVTCMVRTALRVDPKLGRRVLWYLADSCALHAPRRLLPSVHERLCPKLKPGVSAA